MDYSLTFVVLALVAGAQGGPARLRASDSSVPSTCSTTCTGNNKFSYEVGSTYQYKYEAETQTSMVGASQDISTIGITAIVDIEFLSKCEVVLKVHDTSIFAFDSRQYADQDLDKSFANELEKYPLRFSFQDGVLASVCPNEDDKTWSVNIKKGILSAVQNSMDSFDIDFKGIESDVSGECDTEYEVVQRGWKTLSISKTKDLDSCSHRQGFDSAIQTSPFRVSSGMKSLPIMKSSHSCDQEVSTQGALVSSVCHEVHLFRPFSKDASGATTEVTQKLSFIQNTPGTSQDTEVVGGKPKDLFFSHAHETDVVEFNAKPGMDFLKNLCVTMATDVTHETSTQFSELVSIMKKTDFAGLKRIYNQVTKDSFCKTNAERISKFATDAIPMVGTDASIELIKYLISNDFVTGTTADMWLASLAFVHHPTKEMINYLQELTGLPSLSTKILLPLSAMVQAYCRVNPLCGEVQEIMDLVDILQNNLDNQCQVDQQNYRKIMLTLRALGNTGHAEAAVPSLYQCIERADNPMDIRVAAIQAFRRLDCATDRNNLMQLYRDDSQDSELRINAYLAVIKCPNPYVVSQIRETLDSEEVNQVGSFVWSHLTNLMESSDPENKVVQQLLEDETLNTEFDLEKMKYSRNYEASYYMDNYNTGAKMDSNIIWSSKSFVPRSASLNLTFNLFGESMNLFELGGRVEGLETMLESYLGPAGYFNAKDRDTNEIPDADPRAAKLSATKFDNIKKQAKSVRDELRGAMYMRMFGNELSYNMFGANTGADDMFSGSEMLNILQKLRNNEPQDISLMKNVMFLDSTYTIPTVVGLPLKLTVNGTASVALNVGGQADMKDPRKNVVIEGNFQPSGSVEIDSMMGIDAVVTRGGLKMLSTLYTSTGATGKIQLDEGNVFSMTFDLTKDKSEIVDVKSSFYIVYNGLEREQKMIADNREEKKLCTGDKLIKLAGIQFCAGMSMPNAGDKPHTPNFPFTGPVQFSVDMTKQDLPNGYKLEAKMIKTPVMSLFRILSDTPSSTNDRAIGLDVTVMSKDKTVDVSFLSPWKQATMKGQLFDTANVKGLAGNINVDQGARIYNLDAKFLVDQTKDRITYTPQVSITTPHWKDIQVSGVMNLVVKKVFESFDADLIITGTDDDVPITFQTNVLNTKTKIGASVKYSHMEDQEYIFEAMSDRKIEKKRLRSRYMYQPTLYVRTPDKELIKFNADINCVGGKSLKASGKLEKLTRIPFSMNLDLSKVEIPKKKRVKYQARVKVDGPKLANKLMLMVDNRGNKNIFVKTRLDYNILRKYKDTLMGNARVKLNMYEHKQMVKLTSDINSLKNNDLDASLVMNFMKNRYKSNLDSTFKYGVNLKDKDTKERIDLAVVTVAKERGDQLTVNYTVNVKCPAKKVDVTVSGGNIHNERTVGSDIKIQYHPERTVAFSIRYHNKTGQYHNYYGALGIILPEGREMSFAAAVGRETANKYVSNLEFEVIKGRRTRIETLLKIATEKMYEFEVGVKLPDLEAVRVLGAYSKLDNGHKVEAAYRKADKLYSINSEVMYEPMKTGKFIFDLGIPARRVKIILGGSAINTAKHMLVDVQWNADKNLNERFLTNLTYDVKGADDFEVSSTLHYPDRTIEFNIKHNAAARYITNMDLSWSPKEKIEFNIIFRDDIYNDADRTELSVDFASPFKGYEKLGLAVSLIKNSEQFQTKSSVIWARNKKILVSATAKIPLSIESVDIVGSITTPYSEYKSMTAQLKHRFKDGLQSSMLVQWGRNRLSLNTVGQLLYTKATRSFNGNFDLRTPFDGIRVLIVTAEHMDDYKKFNSKFTLDTSESAVQAAKDKYEFEFEMDHEYGRIGLVNTGSIKLVHPNDDITSTWELSQQTGRTRAMLDIQPKRNNRFMIEFAETHALSSVHNKVTSKFELMIPTEDVRELLLSFSHEDRPGFVKTSCTLTKDNLKLISANVGYIQNIGSVQLDSLITSAYSEDVVFKVSSVHSVMPYRGSLELSWGDTPWKITANSNLFYNHFGNYRGSLTINTPVPEIQTVSFSTRHGKSNLNWESDTTLSFAQQNINCNLLYRYDYVKLADLKLSSNFPRFPGLKTSFRLDGGKENFNGDASFAMQPYVGKISTDFNWQFFAASKISGAFNIDTPFRQYPYLKSKLESDMMGMSRVSSFQLEYLPTQIIKLELDHRFTSLETLEGTLKVTSPFTENKQVIATFTHVGDREEFNSKAKITCDCIKKPVFAAATFTTKAGLLSTFKMESPFRGYKTVNWDLNHQAVQGGYHTKAMYETNGKMISFENLLTVLDKLQWQMTFLTPFANITRTHMLMTHQGKFPNTQTHTEVAYNENMITSHFDLSHSTEKSMLDVTITTPFERYEDIKGKVIRTGTVTDVTASADLTYSLAWHASLRHKLEPEHMLTSVLLKCPYLEDDVAIKFNYTGKPLDSRADVDYTMGDMYHSAYKSRFLYDMPNVLVTSKTTTTVMDEVRVNAFTLKHQQSMVPSDVNIESQFLWQVRDYKVNSEVVLSMVQSQPGNMDMTAMVLVELPIEDYSYNKLFYEAKSMSHYTDTSFDTSQGYQFTFETPQLEKLSEVSSTTFDGKTYQSKITRAYGDMLWTQETFWRKGYMTYKFTTPHEGYESGSVVATYTHPEAGVPLTDFNADVTIKSSCLRAPVVITTQNTNDMLEDILLSVDGNVKISYLRDQEVVLEYTYQPGQLDTKMQTTHEGYESASLKMGYSLTNIDLIVTSSSMDTPITYKSVLDIEDVNDLKFSQLLTTGFTNYTHQEFVLSSEHTKKINQYKPYLMIRREDENRNVEEMMVDGVFGLKVEENGNTKASFGIEIVTPYEQLNKFNVQLKHGSSMAPLRIADEALIAMNEYKYLDVKTEMGALNKFSGGVTFSAPREMEFSFSALNEGESVDADLLLNWDKKQRDSNFRLEFALADTGDTRTEKKNFQMKIMRPGRIISITNKYEKASFKITSAGTLAWDLANGKQVTYEATGSTLVSGLDTKHKMVVDVTVPSRTVSMTGSLNFDRQSRVGGSSVVYWDAKKDDRKRVIVNLDVRPYDTKKTALLSLGLPSLNKNMSLSTELAISAVRGFDGKTTLSYSPDTKKNVVLSYNMHDESNTWPNYRAGFTLDHAATNTRCEVTGSLKSAQKTCTGDLSLRYTNTRNSNVKALSLTSEVDLENRQLNVQLSTPYKSAALVGSMTSASPYRITMETQKNNKVLWKNTYDIDTDARSLDAIMTFDGMKSEIITEARFPNGTSFESETETNGAYAEKQGRVAATLNHRLLHGHMKWRPELVKDVINYGAVVMQDVAEEVSPLVEEGMKDFGGILVAKQRAISASLGEELRPLTDSYEAELREWQQDLRQMRRELKKMYKDNELYLKTMDEAYAGTVKSVMTGYSIAIARLNEAYTKAQEYMDALSAKLDDYPFQEKYNALVQTISQAIQNAEIVLVEEVNSAMIELLTGIDKISAAYNETLTGLSEEFTKLLEALLDEFALTPYMDNVQAAYDKLFADYLSLDGVDQPKLRKMLLEVHEMFNDAMDQATLPERYRKVYMSAKKIMSENFDGLMENKDIADMHLALQELYEQASWIYEYTEMNMSLRKLLTKLVQKIRSKIMEDFNQLPLGLLDLHKSKVTTFDLENGEIEFDLYLPIPMENFDEMMKFTVNKYVANLKKMADKYFPRRDICLWDLYYRLPHIQWSTERDWVPPFDVFGTVSGKQHFKTFDGHHYDIAGLCSYVLAQDLANNNFSVVLKYTGGTRTIRKESIVAMVNGKTVEMFQTYQVMIDGLPAELPYRSEGLTIKRSGNKIVLDSFIGLSVITDFNNDYHMIGLSGWYYGNVGGLLGNFDNEAVNDIMMPSGEVETRERRYLKAWEVDESCKSSAVVVKRGSKPTEACTATFEASLSSLRPCFLQVKPEAYLESCETTPEALCDIASLYKETCTRYGISVSLPESCVQCSSESAQVIGSDATLRYEPSDVTDTLDLQESMDVVFVVEERQCNRDMANKLKTVVSRLEDRLNKLGTQDNRYSLVGYEGTEVASHTMEGQLFNDADKFAMGLENLRFNNLGPYADPLSAVVFASRLPYRAGVKKTIVLVSCSPCQEAQGYSYTSLSSELKQKDIALHVMRETAFNLKTNRSPNSPIYGLDNSKLIYGQSRRSQRTMFSDIDIPQDYCASLALNTNGSVFDSGNLLAGSVLHQRMFMDRFSERVKQQPGYPCQVCTCELDHNGESQFVCRRCDMQAVNFKPSKYAINKFIQYKNTAMQTIQSVLY